MRKETSFSSQRKYGVIARGGSSLGRAFLHHVSSLAYGSDQQYNHDRFGFIGRLLPWLGLINIPAVQQVHRNINCWTNEQAMAWKQSTTESCTTVAVVGSIFTSITIAGLSLPDLDACPWTAKAFIVTSMILAILAVAEATSLQQKIAGLNNHLDVRLWLSRGSSPRSHSYQSMKSFHLFPLESSVASVEALRMPRLYVFCAGWVFAVGMGIYLGSLWINETRILARVKQRNVFVTFVAVLGVLLIHDICLSLFEARDQGKRIKDFDMNNANAHSTSHELRTLENILIELRKLNEGGDEQLCSLKGLETHIMTLRGDLLHEKHPVAAGHDMV